MHYLDQILLLPYAYAWIPGLVFFVFIGGFYWLSRPSPQLAEGAGIEIQSSVEATLEKKQKEQRGAFRRHGNPVEVHVALLAHKEAPEIGSLLDRSVGGMRLAVFTEFAIGSVIAVRPAKADAIVPWVELEIRSCKPSVEMPDQFEIGCQYVKAPPYSIQLLFG